MLIKIGTHFELETGGLHSLYLSIGTFERFWNRLGLPDGTWPKGTY